MRLTEILYSNHVLIARLSRGFYAYYICITRRAFTGPSGRRAPTCMSHTCADVKAVRNKIEKKHRYSSNNNTPRQAHRLFANIRPNLINTNFELNTFACLDTFYDYTIARERFSSRKNIARRHFSDKIHQSSNKVYERWKQLHKLSARIFVRFALSFAVH